MFVFICPENFVFFQFRVKNALSTIFNFTQFHHGVTTGALFLYRTNTIRYNKLYGVGYTE